MAEVDFGGVRKDVCLAYLPEVRTDDYVIVHVGFAIQQLDERRALETLAEFRRFGLLDEEFTDPFTSDDGADMPAARHTVLDTPAKAPGSAAHATGSTAHATGSAAHATDSATGSVDSAAHAAADRSMEGAVTP